jgi:outer membrane protein assembly factor BamB
MSNNAIWEDMPGALPGGIWSTPAYFQETVYYGDVGGTLKAFAIQQALLGKTPASQTSMTFGYPGTAPAVSANGANNGIVWAVENSQPAVLHAFAAGNLATELYNSNQAAAGRDHFGAGNKFMTPSIANGKVYVGTPTGVAVFGLLQ